MEVKTKREAVIELINKLFLHTDARQWDKLLTDVFKEKVHFDMSSMGAGAAKELPAAEICKMWDAGFKDLDAVHHHAGNFVVDFFNEEVQAKVQCYATAVHLKHAATKGKTREFVGSYDIEVSFTDLGWRIDKFRYN